MGAVSVQAAVWTNVKAVALETAILIAPEHAEGCVKATVANHVLQPAEVTVMKIAPITAVFFALATMNHQFVLPVK